jgi:hypothetical protein
MPSSVGLVVQRDRNRGERHVLRRYCRRCSRRGNGWGHRGPQEGHGRPPSQARRVGREGRGGRTPSPLELEGVGDSRPAPGSRLTRLASETLITRLPGPRRPPSRAPRERSQPGHGVGQRMLSGTERVRRTADPARSHGSRLGGPPEQVEALARRIVAGRERREHGHACGTARGLGACPPVVVDPLHKVGGPSSDLPQDRIGGGHGRFCLSRRGGSEDGMHGVFRRRAALASGSPPGESLAWPLGTAARLRRYARAEASERSQSATRRS